MWKVEIICDRCKTKIQGMRDDDSTSGYYNLTVRPWSKFSRPGERFICDACMQKDTGYMSEYGDAAAGEERQS